jgi:metallo-beta-lactamase family protein
MNITFYGAAQTVTGSKHLLKTVNGKQLLLDCGLFQNKGSDNETLNRNFGFDPAQVDYMILSHAHMDHSGLIPLLVKSGFTGPVYCTSATRDLCEVMLADSAHIQEHDVIYLNKKRKKRGQSAIAPIYKLDDVTNCLKQFVIVKLNEWTDIDSGIRFMFTDAGHILGSCAVNLEIKESGKIKRIFFSGDVGRYTDIILREPQTFPQADVVICESTYGDRLHESTENAESKLLKIVIDTCVTRRGKLIIPAFSLGRTQELVYALDRLNSKGLMPKVPVYIDSPLAVNATEIMRKHTESFNPEILEYMKKDPDPFGYDKVTYIREVEESKSLNDLPEPCIIISASGMMEAGRIKHHIKNNISGDKNTILIVGYVPPNTLGGKLLDGAKEVAIFGVLYPVNAKIELIDTYSAHADYNELIKYLSCQNPEIVKQFFMVHGDPPAQSAFKLKLEKAGFHHIEIPAIGDSFELN